MGENGIDILTLADQVVEQGHTGAFLRAMARAAAIKASAALDAGDKVEAHRWKMTERHLSAAAVQVVG